MQHYIAFWRNICNYNLNVLKRSTGTVESYFTVNSTLTKINNHASLPKHKVSRSRDTKRFRVKFRRFTLFRLRRVGRINELVGRRAKARNVRWNISKQARAEPERWTERKRARNRSQSTRIIIANKVDVKGVSGRAGGPWSLHGGTLRLPLRGQKPSCRLASGPTRVKVLLSLFSFTVVELPLSERNRATKK